MRVPQSVGQKGSLRWVQALVQRAPERLELAIRDAGAPVPRAIQWSSPRVDDANAEYRDGAFLDQLGLAHLRPQLRDFWPVGGPQWDALGRASDDVFLVEAKAHTGELTSSCAAEAPRSLDLIQSALALTRAELGANASADWMRGYYQYANRLAHHVFLRRHGVKSTLVFLYFTGDDVMNGPRDAAEWAPALAAAKRALGFAPDATLPGVYDVFVSVADLR